MGRSNADVVTSRSTTDATDSKRATPFVVTKPESDMFKRDISTERESTTKRPDVGFGSGLTEPVLVTNTSGNISTSRDPRDLPREEDVEKPEKAENAENPRRAPRKDVDAEENVSVAVAAR